MGLFLPAVYRMFGLPGNDGRGGEYGLEPEVYGRFLIDLFELWYMDYRKGRQPYIRQFENYIAILMGSYPDACEQNGVCGLQNVVEADGSVYPCDFYVLDGYGIGNLNQNPLRKYTKKEQYPGLWRIPAIKLHGVKTAGTILCAGAAAQKPCEEEQGQAVNCFCKSYQMFFDRCYDRLCRIAEELSFGN